MKNIIAYCFLALSIISLSNSRICQATNLLTILKDSYNKNKSKKVSFYYCPLCRKKYHKPYYLYKHYGKHRLRNCSTLTNDAVFRQIIPYVSNNLTNSKKNKKPTFLILKNAIITESQARYSKNISR